VPYGGKHLTLLFLHHKIPVKIGRFFDIEVRNCRPRLSKRGTDLCSRDPAAEAEPSVAARVKGWI
jgi:hypothetical protein